MTNKKDASEPTDAVGLRQMFHEMYGNGRDFEGETLIAAVISAGKFLSEIIGTEATDKGMALIVRDLGYTCDADGDWAEALASQASGDAYCWPLGAKFHNLNCYANFGIALNGGATSEQRKQEIDKLIKETSAFMSKVPFDAWQISPGDAAHTLRLAKGRWALDMGQTIEPYALAQFGNVTEGRIRNLMAGHERVFVTNNGQIPAKQALAWLRSRRTFRPSRWKVQETFEDLAEANGMIDDQLFVPVARDGSFFHPGLAKNGSFTIGRPGEETNIANFDDALLALQKQSIPVWRRPTAKGVWNHVSAVKWERMSRAEFQ
jgi:hypothetical protein